MFPPIVLPFLIFGLPLLWLVILFGPDRSFHPGQWLWRKLMEIVRIPE